MLLPLDGRKEAGERRFGESQKGVNRAGLLFTASAATGEFI
ncbi:hypothetical protein ACVXG7_20905 [Enterobacter hormaechei]